MDRLQTGANVAEDVTKSTDIDYNGAQNQAKSRPQTRGTAQLAAGVHLLPTGGIFKSAAVEVLRRERRLMATGEICKLALEWGLLKCSGKTPEATMASSLYGDIKRNNGACVFFRPRGGIFGLKEWVDQGLFPVEALVVPINTSQITYTGKRQRKNTSSKPPMASKRQQRVQGGPASGTEERDTVVDYFNNLGTQQGSKHTIESISLLINDPNTLQKSSLQHNPSSGNDSTTYAINSITPATAGTLAAEQQPRRRLLTSETNENASLHTSVAISTAAPQHDVGRAAVMEQERKVAAVENKWGPLHPRAGQAHLLLYKACKQQAIRFPSVEGRARTALTRAYDIMMFNNQVEELGKLQGRW